MPTLKMKHITKIYKIVKDVEGVRHVPFQPIPNLQQDAKG